MARTPAQSGNDQRMIGKTVAGRYALVRMLGDGGMGAVYKAEDNVLRRFVAIKLLHPASAANPAAVERFLREAQAAASIGHPNIIDILDFGESEGKPYLVMEYLRGRSLADALASDGPFSIRRACAVATHALAGLQAAHDRGILHRDLKPANLMLTARFGDPTFVKLLDFGFAALLGEGTPDRHLTPARTLVGTPAYAAPERLRGDDRRDPRTDLYAIGVVLFEMLAGVRPFDASSFSELARKVQNDAAPALRLYRPDAPEGLERVVAKALSKKLEDRFANAEALAAALVPFGGRLVESDESISDSLSMDLLRIRARERKHGPTGRGGRASQTAPPGPSGTQTHDSDDLAIDRLSLDLGTRAQPPADPGRRTLATPITAHSRPSLASEREPFLERRTEKKSASSLPDETIRSRPSLEALGLAGPVGAEPPAASPGIMPSKAPPIAPPKRPAAPRASAPKAAGARSASPAGESRTREVEASAGLSILRFVSRRYGERALAGVLGALPEDARSVFSAGLSPGVWISFKAVSALVEAIDGRLGRDDLHLIADCGRAIAEGTAERLQAQGQPSPPPELLLAEMPRYVGSLIRGAYCRVRSIGRGYGRIELDELSQPASLTLCVMVLGILDRTLSRFGSQEVEVNLLNCRYLGDDENLFDISWLVA